jgi:hypothetical protein
MLKIIIIIIGYILNNFLNYSHHKIIINDGNNIQYQKNLNHFLKKNHFVNVEIDLKLWYSLSMKRDWNIIIIISSLQWIK